MNEVVHTSPTIGSNVEEVVWRNIHFIMWDLGGQQSLRAAWSTYYTNTEVSLINFINHSTISINTLQIDLLLKLLRHCLEELLQ